MNIIFRIFATPQHSTPSKRTTTMSIAKLKNNIIQSDIDEIVKQVLVPMAIGDWNSNNIDTRYWRMWKICNAISKLIFDDIHIYQIDRRDFYELYANRDSNITTLNEAEEIWWRSTQDDKVPQCVLRYSIDNLIDFFKVISQLSTKGSLTEGRCISFEYEDKYFGRHHHVFGASGTIRVNDVVFGVHISYRKKFAVNSSSEYGDDYQERKDIYRLISKHIDEFKKEAIVQMEEQNLIRNVKMFMAVNEGVETAIMDASSHTRRAQFWTDRYDSIEISELDRAERLIENIISELKKELSSIDRKRRDHDAYEQWEETMARRIAQMEEDRPRIVTYTYLVKNKRNGLYKIGYSSNPANREKTLQSEEPENEMIWKTPVNCERELHKKFEKYRKRGEWFELTKVQVAWIVNIYGKTKPSTSISSSH